MDDNSATEPTFEELLERMFDAMSTQCPRFSGYLKRCSEEAFCVVFHPRLRLALWQMSMHENGAKAPFLVPPPSWEQVDGTMSIFAGLVQFDRGVSANLASDIAKRVAAYYPPEVDWKTEYDSCSDEGPTTTWFEVLSHAERIAERQREVRTSTDHLLLALIDNPGSTFRKMTDASQIDLAPIRSTLVAYMGLETRLRPRTRAYEICTQIECDLTDALIMKLKKEYGQEVKDWWARGVPKKVRLKCSATREDEGCILDSDAYLHLIDLVNIIVAKGNWRIFGLAMEAASKNKGKDAATAWIGRLNRIRNVVMHPTKREVTSEDIDGAKDAFRIAKTFCANLDADEASL